MHSLVLQFGRTFVCQRSSSAREIVVPRYKTIQTSTISRVRNFISPQGQLGSEKPKGEKGQKQLRTAAEEIYTHHRYKEEVCCPSVCLSVRLSSPRVIKTCLSFVCMLYLYRVSRWDSPHPLHLFVSPFVKSYIKSYFFKIMDSMTPLFYYSFSYPPGPPMLALSLSLSYTYT